MHSFAHIPIIGFTRAIRGYFGGNKSLKTAWREGLDSVIYDTMLADPILKGTLGLQEKSPIVIRQSFVQNAVFRLLTLSPLLAGKIPVKEQGVENIPIGGAIYATTHLSDQDVLLVANSIRNHGKDISIASQSTNFEAPIVAIPQKLAGPERFLSIKSTKTSKDIQGSSWQYLIHQEDIVNMVHIMEYPNKSLIIAGHRPTHDGNLPKSTGIGAIIVAFQTGKPLVPSVVFPGRPPMMRYFPPMDLPILNEEEKEELKQWTKNIGKFSNTGVKNLLRNNGFHEKLKQAQGQLLDIYKTALGDA